MPNIELFGFNGGESITIERRIRKLFENSPWKKDYVVTNHSSVVADHNNNRQPYIRVTSTQNEHLDTMAQDISLMFNVDIEVLILAKFVPKTVVNSG